MNEHKNITLGDLFHTWQTYILRLMMTVPQDGIAELDGRERRKRSGAGAIVWVITALIVTLALASIANLSDRAYAHKAGFSANVVGIGLALLVPVGVHVAVKIRGAWAKGFVWIMSALFAFISGAIQYQIYAPAGPFGWSKDHLEALAFGAGVPVAECMLAAILAVVVAQANSESDNRKQLEVAEVKADHQRELAERLRLQEIEDVRQRRLADDEHRRQMQMAEAEAKREERRIKLDAKLSSQVSSKLSTEQQKRTVQPEKSVNPTEDEQLLEQLRTLVQQQKESGKVNKSQLASEIGVSRTTLYRMLDAIPEHQPAYTNGHGPH